MVKQIRINSIEPFKQPINLSTYNLAKFIETHPWFDKPIRVKQLRTGQYRVKDGRHRVTARKLLGFETITADVCEVDINT